jgi:hypothetical protein
MKFMLFVLPTVPGSLAERQQVVYPLAADNYQG